MANSTRNEKIESRVDDRNAEWFLASGGRHWTGPLTLAAIVRKLLRHEVTLSHLVWKKGLARWQPIQDTREFHSVLREMPSGSPDAGPEGAAARAPEQWYLSVGKRRYGPYASQEIIAFLEAGKIDTRVYAWRQGMAGWARLSALQEFSHFQARVSPDGENRGSPRRALVAKVLFTDDESVIEASCKDISQGGMLVVTERTDFMLRETYEVGARIRVNVSPLNSDKGASGNRIKAFAAEGRIVRKLKNGRGFSFRFEKLSENARRAIDAFIHPEAA